ncbi:MAG: hypothetical protein J4432_00645 [DPANN group archaeon]|nr:hypothetical protein [DPANN group archaeon]
MRKAITPLMSYMFIAALSFTIILIITVFTIPAFLEQRSPNLEAVKIRVDKCNGSSIWIKNMGFEDIDQVHFTVYTNRDLGAMVNITLNASGFDVFEVQNKSDPPQIINIANMSPDSWYFLSNASRIFGFRC